LGHNLFSEELHITDVAELSWSVYQGTKAPTDSRSQGEIIHQSVIEAENKERSSRKQATPSGIGGYHSVTIPLSSKAISELKKLQSGEANFIELAVDDAQHEIIVVNVAKSVSVSTLSKEINNTEPRFYVFNNESILIGSTIPKKNFCIYLLLP